MCGVHQMILEEKKGCHRNKSKHARRMNVVVRQAPDLDHRISLATRGGVAVVEHPLSREFLSLQVMSDPREQSCLIAPLLHGNISLTLRHILIIGRMWCAVAAGSNCPWSVEILLNAGANSEVAVTGSSCLQWAVQNGAHACIRLLLGSGVDPNFGAEPPLNTAVAYGFADITKILIDAAADSNASRSAYHPSMPPTALFAAAQMGRAAIANILLDAKADVNRGRIHVGSDQISMTYGRVMKGRVMMSPLWISSWEGHEDVVRILIAHNADITFESPLGDMISGCNAGNTALAAATNRGHKSVVRLLLRSENEDLILPSGAQAGSLKSVKTGGGIVHKTDEIHQTDFMDMIFQSIGRQPVVTNSVQGDAHSIADYVDRKTCDYCSKITSVTKKCAGCHQRYFCSVACQVKPEMRNVLCWPCVYYLSKFTMIVVFSERRLANAQI